METQEVTLHNELKHKSIFLRDFTTAAQMLRQVLRQVLRRCFGRCCTDASAVAAQMFRQLLRRCFGRCCTDALAGAAAGAAQMLRQVLRRCFGSCGNEREYHCTRQKVRLRHCCPPCSLCCRVASVACSFSKVRLRLVILLGSCPDSHVTRSCEWRFPSENSSTSFESWYRWRHKVLQRSTSVRYRTAMPPFRSSYAIFPPLSTGWLHFRWCCSSQSRTALQP